MCGISGILGDSSEALLPIEAMTASLAHRGPDAGAIWTDPTRHAALGHRRLSVIDLSTTANQPMRLAGTGLTIVFNGEIYNFRELRKQLLQLDPTIHFTTQSDTETILHAYRMWKNEMPLKLDGMFALAIYESESGNVFLCRDRMGKKPLFYFADTRHFVFASEIKALLKHPVVQAGARTDYQALREFIHLGFVPEHRTGWENIHRFPAASWANVSIGQPVRSMSYWSAREEIKVATESLVNPVQELGGLIEAAVNKRLISDVPLGTFLSGGTDSSLVTAIASRIKGGALKTFNIGFEEAKFDESRYATEVAAYLGTTHQSYILKEREAMQMLEGCMAHFDEPFADASAVPTLLVSKLARKEVTVSLTGDGGDELFLGYGAYHWARRLHNPLIRMGGAMMAPVLRTLGNSRWKRIGHLVEHVEDDALRSHIFSQEQYFFSKREIDNGLLKHHHSLNLTSFRDVESFDAKRNQALFDLENYLRDDLLVKVDRASMYSGLECRCPLLDKDVVSFAMKLPVHLRSDKRLLKMLLRNYLPERLVERKKWGFSIPLGQWLKGELRYLVDDFLHARIVKEIGFFEESEVEKLKTRFFQGDSFLYNRLWVMILTQKWLKTYGR